MLSILLATEARYVIKENNNREKSFYRGKLPLCRRKLPFCWRKLRKAYFASAFFFFFLPAQITILPKQIEKSLFCRSKENLNCKGWYERFI